MLTTVIFILHNRNPETQKPRNRVSFRDTTVILGNHNRNPVSFAPRKNSQKPGFLESDRQLSLFSTTETRFLSSQATNPRNRTQKPGFFYAYHSYLYSPPKKPGFFPPSNKPQKPNPETGFLLCLPQLSLFSTKETRFLSPKQQTPETGFFYQATGNKHGI